MRVLLSAATYDLPPSHLYLRAGLVGKGGKPSQRVHLLNPNSTLLRQPSLPHHQPQQVLWPPKPLRKELREQQHSEAGPHLLSPSSRSTAAKRCSAASRLVTRADTSRVSEVHASYVRLTCPQLRVGSKGPAVHRKGVLANGSAPPAGTQLGRASRLPHGKLPPAKAGPSTACQGQLSRWR